MAGSEELLQQARLSLAVLPEDHPDRGTWLNNLGVELAYKYQRTANIALLNEAIEVGRQTLATTSDSNSIATCLSNLSSHLSEKYLRSRNIEDIAEAIRLGHEALQSTPNPSPERPTRLNNLAVALSHKYAADQIMGDLDRSIETFRECVQSGEDGDSDTAKYLNDLKESIHVGRQAVAKTLAHDPERPARVTNLGTVLMSSFERTGNRKHLDESTHMAREAIGATAESHLDSLMYSKLLGQRLEEQYTRSANLADLEEAIRVSRNVLISTRHDDPDRVWRLHSLSSKLNHRFDRLGRLVDLHEAIQLAQDACSEPPNHSRDRDRAVLLGHLGDLLASRHSRTGSIQDLEEAISKCREAIPLCPEGPLGQASHHNSLGLWLGERYSILGAMSDLNEAIENTTKAVEITSDDHPDLAAWLDNLGNQLYSKYLRTQAISDLKGSIQAAKQAVQCSQKDNPSYAILLNNLATSLMEMFEESADPVVELTPDDHPQRTIFLTNLGLRLGDKCLTTPTVEDITEAAIYCDKALRQPNSAIPQRLRAGILAVGYYGLVSKWEAAFEAGSVAVPLIAKLTPRSLETSDKQFSLGQIAGLASSAAAAAAAADVRPFAMLCLLEQGRGIVAASLEEMRNDVLDLQSQYPQLAKQFNKLRDELQPSVDGDVTILKQRADPSNHQRRGGRVYEANERLDKLIIEIRQNPGFEHFLGIPSEDAMKEAARDGPIVVVNACYDRCDAILVQQAGISILPLPKLKNNDIESRAREGSLANLKILVWLWDAFASSVLRVLGFPKAPPSGQWPRIWWVLTGALVNFPIHAAGRHYPGSTETVLDRVMSSYVSSVKALIHGRSRPRHQVQPTAQFATRALLINMHNTPRQGILPFATKEISMIRDICNAMSVQYSEPGRTKRQVVSHLKNCEIFHFAGHGLTDSLDPALSCLLLDDWEVDPLTVGSLFEMNLRKRSPFLAYLSACGTGQTKEEKLADESFHLIGACQLAGFRHVIGTLWEVGDELCLEVARITYQELLNGIMSDESVCRGLHKATRDLRDRWLQSAGNKIVANFEARAAEEEEDANDDRGSRKAVLCKPDSESDLEFLVPLQWSPYVHFGV
ncbi:uncharacterized protein PG986_011218 [Apiospora aurea]|uniref:CHAT domain-containing protein n=1 Tax=Apiospora aurea TaxID=335848 RepID=A0ABR1Q4M8_9PEZI